MIDRVGAAGAGVIGALVLMLMTDASRWIGLIEANLTRYQGCILVGRSEGATPFFAGLAMHLAMGAVLAIGYAVLFALLWGNATWWGGMLIGAVHEVAAGTGFPVLDRLNPCVRDGRMRGFAFFGIGYGPMMTLGLLAGHLVFGATVGWLYTVPGQ